MRSRLYPFFPFFLFTSHLSLFTPSSSVVDAAAAAAAGTSRL